MRRSTTCQRGWITYFMDTQWTHFALAPDTIQAPRHEKKLANGAPRPSMHLAASVAADGRRRRALRFSKPLNDDLAAPPFTDGVSARYTFAIPPRPISAMSW